MSGWIVIGGGALLAVALVVWVAMVVSLRTGFEPGMTAIRRFNRRVGNPRVMKKAGQPGAYAGVIRHVGRRSGTAYETPVGVVDTEEGFLVVLPYGTTPDWLKNVRAAGSAEIVHEGHTFSVTDPEVLLAADFAHHQSRRERFVQRLYGVDLVLRLQKVDARVGEPR